MNGMRLDDRPAGLELAPGEELVCVRAGTWRMYVPMRYVERVHPAALPVLAPCASGEAAPVIGVAGALLPVAFAAALLGAADVHLSPEHQMLLLGDGARRALLWVDFAEDVVAHAPVPGPPAGATAADLVAAWSGRDLPLPVLDVPGLLSLVS